MFRSDDACAMATTLMPPVSSAVKTRAEMPRVPAMPSPTTATTESEVRADTVDQPLIDLVTERVAHARDRAPGLALPER